MQRDLRLQLLAGCAVALSEPLLELVTAERDENRWHEVKLTHDSRSALGGPTKPLLS